MKWALRQGVRAHTLFLVVCLVLVAVLEPQTYASQKASDPDKATVQVLLTPMAGGRWRVDYTFTEPGETWIFSRSNGDYRLQTWETLESGVNLERIDGFDTVLLDAPREQISFVLTPFSEGIPKDYTPFIKFSDGGIAAYTGQFELLPMTDREAVQALAGDLDLWVGQQPWLEVRLVHDLPMVMNGRIFNEEANYRGLGVGTYIYVGDTPIQQGTDFVGIIDSGLPRWLLRRLDKDLASVFDAHRSFWNRGLSEKATVYFAFGGAEKDGFSSKGGALDLLLVLETSGRDLRRVDANKLIYFKWFFAHEVAHLFQRRDGVTSTTQRDAWIHEGAANAMAMFVLESLGSADEDYISEEYAKTFTQCVEFLENGSLQEAGRRGDFKAFYSCGDLISQMSAAALGDYNLFDVWNHLLDEAAKTKDKKYSSSHYFDGLRELGAAASLVAGLERLTNEHLEDPRSVLVELMQESGLAVSFDNEGKLTGFELP